MTDQLWKMSAAELAALIRDGRASSREVVEAHLVRIGQVNPQLNAVTRTLEETAFAAADRADQAKAAGQQLGPLHGVPITVKENIDLTGSATTQGLAAMAEAVPPVDAPHVERMKAAGAIPMGRTNLPDFGLRWHTDNALHGPTKNPWNPAVTPGGSSGGEAAALATGMTPLGLGNDYGGSLRWPSACNGTCALKPTYGRVADASALNPAELPITIQLFAVQGPMARRVDDLRTAYRAMAGRHPRDPHSLDLPAEAQPVEGPLRVALVRHPGTGDVHPDVVAGVEQAAKALEDSGYVVDEVAPPRIDDAALLWQDLVITEVKTAFLPMAGPMLGDDARRFLDQTTALVEDRVGEPTLERYIQGLAERNAVAREWAQFFEDHPLILGPVNTQPPFEVGADIANPERAQAVVDSMRLLVIPNLLGLPVAAVPAGVANGLPQGVQIMGGRYREDLCLDAAAAIEERLGTFTPIEPKA